MNITVIRLFLFLQIILIIMAALVQCKDNLFKVILHELNEMVTYSRLRVSLNYDERLKLDHINITHLINFQYYGKINIGRPKQSFRVIFDTSTADFWVMSIKNIKRRLVDIYMKKTSHSHKTYNSKKSDTYKKKGKKITIRYRTGKTTGILSNDRVSLGGKMIQNHTFMESIRDSRVPFAYLKVDGVFGLAYRNLAHGRLTPPFYTMIAQKVVENPVFSFYFPRYVNVVRSLDTTRLSPVIIFGGSDNQRYVEPFFYVPVTKLGYWQFDLDAIDFSGKKIRMSTHQAIFDTGTGLIFGPTEDIHKINNLLGAKPLANGIYSLDCEKIPKLPIVKFVISGKSFEIRPLDYILKMKIELKIICVSAFYDINTYNQYKTTDSNSLWVLGNVFISRYYMEFDIGQNRIGIAKLKYSILTNNTNV